MNSKFVSIASFGDTTDAAIAHGILESNGIPCHVQEERTSPNTPQYKGLNGKTLVQVQRKNLTKAMRILKEKGHLRSEDFCVSKWDLFAANFEF